MSKRLNGVEKEPLQDREARWVMQLKKWHAGWKMALLKHLERIDARLSNRQRKWLFYMGMLCWSGFLFYLLGTAIRKPPPSFVLPFVADSSQVSIRQLTDEMPAGGAIERRQPSATTAAADTDY